MLFVFTVLVTMVIRQTRARFPYMCEQSWEYASYAACTGFQPNTHTCQAGYARIIYTPKDANGNNSPCTDRGAQPEQCVLNYETTYDYLGGECSPADKLAGTDEAYPNWASGCQPHLGSYRCTVCAHGKYSDAGNGGECTACPLGRYNPSNDDATSRDGEESCSIRCPATQSTTAENPLQCVSCEPGKVSGVGSACHFCDGDGQEPNSAGTGCQDCAAGKFKNGNTEGVCQTCPEGYTGWGLGRATCKVCAAGKWVYATGTESYEGCVDCPVGKFTGGGSAFGVSYANHECTDCVRARYNDETGATLCKNCASIDTHSTTMQAGATSASQCVRCPDGSELETWKQSSGGGGWEAIPGHAMDTVIASNCDVCEATSYSSGGAPCDYCPRGFAAASNSTECTQCPAASYAVTKDVLTSNVWNRGGTECRECPAGTYNDEPGAQSWRISASDSHSCIFENGQCVGYEVETTCTGCPAGKFSTEGQTSCVTCPGGRYTSRAGGDMYHIATYYVQIAPYVTAGDECVVCAAGKYAPADESLSECTTCPVGYYSAAESINCTACPPGTSSQSGANGIEACTPCAPGTFESEHVCEDCPVGDYTDESGQTGCKTCPLGKSQAQTGQTSCDDCPPGRSTSDVSLGQHNIDAWSEEGHYSSATGTVYTFGARESITVTCDVVCPVGQYARDGSGCLDCPPGTFADSPGTGTCTLCQAATYADTGGQSVCTACPVGRFHHKLGETSVQECSQCPAGKRLVDSSDSLTRNDKHLAFALKTSGHCAYTSRLHTGTTLYPSELYNAPGSTIHSAFWNFGADACKAMFALAQPYLNDMYNESNCVGTDRYYQDDNYDDGRPVQGGKHDASYMSSWSSIDISDGISVDFSTTPGCSYAMKDTYTSGGHGWSHESTFAYGNDYSSNRPECSCGQPCLCIVETPPRASFTCEECPAGSFGPTSGQPCVTCPVGYRSGAHQTSCDACPPGTYLGLTGATLQTACNTCAKNHFSAEGQESCAQCPSGFYKHAAPMSNCEKCPDDAQLRSYSGADIAQYKTQYASCHTQCPSGQFANGDTFVQCEHCPAGFASAADSTFCTECAQGTFAKRGSGVCRNTTTVTGGAAPDNVCFYDTWTVLALQHRAMSDVCGRNDTFVDNVVKCAAGEQFEGECKPCPEGSYSTDEDAGCRYCPLGRSSPPGSDEESDCTPCQADLSTLTLSDTRDMASQKCGCGSGQYFDRDTLTCQPCPAGRGHASFAIGQEECESCPTGTASSEGGECSLCPAQTFQDETGQSDCKSCGGRQSTPDRLECEDCSPGKFIGPSFCEACGKGQYQSGTNQPSCLMCDFGKYADTVLSTECTTCPGATRHSQAGSVTVQDCTECPTGRYVDVDHIGCPQCALATYKDDTSALACSNCALGFQSNINLTACTICPAGTYRGNTENVCVPCPLGTYGDVVGLTSCTPCPAGFFSDVEGQTSCSACNLLSGEWSLTGASACSKCGVGIRPVGYEYCFRCDPGMVLQQPSSYYGTECATGQERKTTCVQSPVDAFCTPCPENQTTNGYTNQCSDMLPGQLQFGQYQTYTISGQYVVQRTGDVGFCPRGWRKDGERCVQCPAGQTSGSLEVSLPDNCPDNPSDWTDAFGHDCSWYETEGYCRDGAPIQKYDTSGGWASGNPDVELVYNMQFDKTGHWSRDNTLLVDNVLACGWDNLGCANAGAYESCAVCNAFTKCEPTFNTSNTVLTLYNVHDEPCVPCRAGTRSTDGRCEVCYNTDGCIPCPAGTFFEDGRACVSCPKGRFQNETNQRACKTCAAGTGTKVGAVTEDDCGTCPAKTFADNGRATYFTPVVHIDVETVAYDGYWWGYPYVIKNFDTYVDGFVPGGEYRLTEWRSNHDMGSFTMNAQDMGYCYGDGCERDCYSGGSAYSKLFAADESGRLSVSGAVHMALDCEDDIYDTPWGFSRRPQAHRLRLDFVYVRGGAVPITPGETGGFPPQSETYFGCHDCPPGTTSGVGSARCYTE